jgi:S-DNA-T family DNA segregation ATPase FtsK/SpoIIIE
MKTLNWLVEEMERRYKYFAEMGAKNIKDFKKKYPEEKMPYIAVVIDEWTDLLDSAKGNEREVIVTAAQRIAQKGRAAGIHEVIMMQAPRAKYIPGSLKANIPAGFAFAVRSKMESQQIINSSGGEQLMGKGDMLMITQQLKEPRRVQAAVVEDDEVDKVVLHLKMQSPPQYDDDLLAALTAKTSFGGMSSHGGSEDVDPLYDEVLDFVIQEGEASTSKIGRKFRLGYGRSARIIDQMEERGLVGPKNGSKAREVLVSSRNEIDSDADE